MPVIDQVMRGVKQVTGPRITTASDWATLDAAA